MITSNSFCDQDVHWMSWKQHFQDAAEVNDITFVPAPDDCYEADGEFYRGSVSMTVDGSQCLDWNSAFVRQKGGDPFQDYAGFDGIGPHNYCRSEYNLCKEFLCLPLS